VDLRGVQKAGLGRHDDGERLAEVLADQRFQFGVLCVYFLGFFLLFVFSARGSCSVAARFYLLMKRDRHIPFRHRLGQF